MSIVKQAVWGESKDIVQISIERIKMFEPPEGYYVAFSGGKDSIVTLDLVRRAGVKHDVHMNMTSVDPPELVRFVKQNYPDVVRHKPVTTMWKLIEEHMGPPSRRVRYCCEVLKEGGGSGRFIITGVRWAESPARSKNTITSVCIKDTTKRYLRPIIDWKDEDIWEYIHKKGLAYPSLYDEGHTRIGCVGCPMADHKQAFEKWPGIMARWKKAIYRAAEKRKEVGWKREPDKDRGIWGEVATDGESLWLWWLKEYKRPTNEDQCVLFE